MGHPSQDLLSLCREAEASVSRSSNVSLHLFPEEGVEAASLLYAHAVSFCEKGGFPWSSIRVRLSSWGIEVKPGLRTPKPQEATILSFFQGQWTAGREGRVPTDPPLAKGEVSLVLEDGPAPLFAPKQENDRWVVKVGRWAFLLATRQRTVWQLFDPWSPRKSTAWHPRALKILKEGKETKEVEEVLQQAASRTLTTAERLQLYESAKKNPYFSQFESRLQDEILAMLQNLRPAPAVGWGYMIPGTSPMLPYDLWYDDD